MADLIDRQAAIRWVKTECNPYGKPTLDFESGIRVIEHLEQMPSAQPDVPDINDGDIISRQAAIEETWKEPSYTDPLNVLAELRDRIKDLPSAQPERKKGKWIYLDGLDAFECSVCGGHVVRNVFCFCPWCGAKMEVEHDND